MINNLAEAKAANKAAGLHFFDPESMEFWRTLVSRQFFPAVTGAFFVTSEQREDHTPRKWTVRHITDGGKVSTVGEFCEWPREEDALTAARGAQARDEWEAE